MKQAGAHGWGSPSNCPAPMETLQRQHGEMCPLVPCLLTASEVYRPVRFSYFPPMSKRVSKEPEVIVRDGKPVSVILPINEYEELLERLEDADDIAYLKKLRSKPLSFRPLSEYLAERSKADV